MLVLVLNAGSSSLKSALIDSETGGRIAEKHVERIGEPDGVADHATALKMALDHLLAAIPEGQELGAVGHRVVHGGAEFSTSTPIDDAVEATIERLCTLAPLHNPANLAGIRAARAQLPDALHVAVFDTAFHATLPRRARVYALPQDLLEKHQLRRYGFHGTSHQYVAHRAAAYLGEDIRDLRIITCHLGNGCSVTAVENGSSVETSMGATPLEGLVMGTRSGDVDAGLLLHLMRQEGISVDEMDELLNRESGLAGLSGAGNDMRDIERRAEEGDERCRLALQAFAHRARKYVGAYAAAMGGVDAIVFTAGIGQHSALIRHRIAQRLDFIGARLDEDRNREAKVSHQDPVAEISEAHSRVRLLVIATDEEHAIAQHARHLAEELAAKRPRPPIPIAVSARHVHLSPEAVGLLFGEGHELTPIKDLSQPGQFACEEPVSVVGPRNTIEKVRVLGPARGKCQIEISRTDEFFLGLDAPVRRSGDVDNTPGVTLVGPAGRLNLNEGVICAWRHIHMRPEDAEAYGVENGDLVEVAITGGDRDLTFGDVMIRVSPKYALEMHIDTDEANAAELGRHSEGMLVATPGQATVLARKPHRLGG